MEKEISLILWCLTVSAIVQVIIGEPQHRVLNRGGQELPQNIQTPRWKRAPLSEPIQEQQNRWAPVGPALVGRPQEAAGPPLPPAPKDVSISSKSSSKAKVNVNSATYVRIHDDSNKKKEACQKFCLDETRKFVCCPTNEKLTDDKMEN